MTTTSTACGHVSRGYKKPCDLDPGHLNDHANIEGETWYNYGQVDLYEITWMSGHIETVPAHQVTYPHAGMVMARMFSSTETAEVGPPRVQLHAELNGRWVLTLSAREEDIRSMRLVTNGEQLPGGAR